jgi:putative RNA 2'-phosphotransferase
VEELLVACARRGRLISRDDLEEIVARNDKRRFVIREGRIRANQGHSIEVNLGIEPLEPPEFLYHGTAERALDSIRRGGLVRMKRHHVHLSSDYATAHRVGSRHGKPVVLRVRAAEMHADGREFYLSENGVWLTDAVPPEYLEKVGV